MMILDPLLSRVKARTAAFWEGTDDRYPAFEPSARSEEDREVGTSESLGSEFSPALFWKVVGVLALVQALSTATGAAFLFLANSTA